MQRLQATTARLRGGPGLTILSLAAAALVALFAGVQLGLVPATFASRAGTFVTGGGLDATVMLQGGGQWDLRAVESIPQLGATHEDRFSHVHAGANTAMALYQNSHYGGTCQTIKGGGEYWPTLYRNDISSIRVGTLETSCDSVTLFGGYNKTHSEGYIVVDRNLGQLDNQLFDSDPGPFQRWGFNDKVSSIEIDQPGVVAFLYENSNFTGRCLAVSSDINDLGIYGFNDRVSSIKVMKGFPSVPATAADAITSDPSALFVKDASHVFARSSSGTLWHRWNEGCSWSNIEDLGAPAGGFVGKPAAASWNGDRMDVFVRGTDGALHQKFWERGKPWSGWHKLSADGQLAGDPAAVSWGNGRYDIFAKGAPDGLWHLWYDGGWRGPENLGGIVIGAPAAASWGPNRLDVFVRSQGDALFVKAFDGTWREWTRISDYNAVASDPTAVSWGSNRIDVFAKGKQNQLLQVARNGSTWFTAELGWTTVQAEVVTAQVGVLESGPAVSSSGSQLLEVYARTSKHSGKLSRMRYDGYRWLEWEAVP